MFDLFLKKAIDKYVISKECTGKLNNPKPTGTPTTAGTGSTGSTSATEAPRGMFKCKDGTYISNDKLCDNYNNCDTGEDEVNCGECAMEAYKHDMCGYRTAGESTPDFGWIYSDKLPAIKDEIGKPYWTAVNDQHVKLDDKENKLVATIESPTIHGAFGCEL